MNSYATLSPKYVRMRYGQRLHALHMQHEEEDFEKVWQKATPHAIRNFTLWYHKALIALNPPSLKARYSVVRLDDSKPFGPYNCTLKETGAVMSAAPHYPVTKTLVAAIKEHLKENPDAPAVVACRKFRPYSPSTIRKIIKEIKEHKR